MAGRSKECYVGKSNTMSGAGSSPGSRSTTTPFDPLYSRVPEIRQFISFFQNFIDVDEFIDIAERVVELPPDRRFTESHELVKAQIEKDFRYANIFSPSTRREFGKVLLRISLSAVDKELDGIQRETFEGAIQEKDDQYLIFGIFLNTLRNVANNAENYINEKETLDQIFPCYIALFSRLVVLQQSDQTEVGEEIVQDIAYGEYYLNRAVGQPTEDPIKELEYSELRRQVVKRGAVLAYAMVGMSVEQASELANISRDEFLGLLSEYGISRRIPSPVQQKARALAIAEDKNSTDLMINTIQTYINERTENENVRQQIADAYYNDELTFEQVEELVGPEQAGNFKVLKDQLENESLREELAVMDDSNS